MLTLPSVWQVLKSISFDVAPGRKVALVGTSGGGKTTIVNLVERFYDPHRGSVLFDGLPLTDIDHDYLHQQVGRLSTKVAVLAHAAYTTCCVLRFSIYMIQLVREQPVAEAAQCMIKVIACDTCFATPALTVLSPGLQGVVVLLAGLFVQSRLPPLPLHACTFV